METKQVIIQNKDEEKQFLEEATKRKYFWFSAMAHPKDHTPSKSRLFEKFPYIIIIESDGEMSWDSLIERLTLTQFLESVDN
jgi:hypothetical protein